MTTDTPLDAFAFLRELESNARTIAASKSGDDRAGWIEDADEFARAIAAAAKLSGDLSECRAALAERQAAIDKFAEADEMDGPVYSSDDMPSETYMKALRELHALATKEPQ